MTSPAAASGGDLQAPGLRRRLACLLYEALLLFGVGLVSGAVGTFALKLAGITQAAPYHAVLQVVGITVYGVYFVWFWWRRGQTLPMQTWHIKLVTSEGRPVSVARAAARYAVGYLWIAPAFVVAALNHWPPVTTLLAAGIWIVVYALLSLLQPQRQYWHDVICGTRLVTAPPQRAAASH